MCRRRASTLIGNYFKLISLSGESQDCFDKVLASVAKDPRSTQNHVPGIAATNALFAGGLAAAICIERPDFVVLKVGCALAPVEYVVGRYMDKWNPKARGLNRNSGRRFGVDGKSRSFFAFGAINIGIGSRVDNDIARPRSDNSSDRTWGLLDQVPPAPVQRHRYCRQPPRLESLRRPGRFRLGEECALQALLADRPRRLAASCFDTSGCHQARLSMYHFTVVRSPDSNVFPGCQPSSALSFEKSIA